MKNDTKRFINFLFEASTLKRIRRTGWQILGVEEEGIAEHTWHATVIGYILSKLANANTNKIVLMLLFHDLGEVRAGDSHKLQQLYSTRDEEKAFRHQVSGLTFSDELLQSNNEFLRQKTGEALLAHDADVLALLFRLKELVDQGNNQAQVWFEGNIDRLQTKEGKTLAETLRTTDSQEWWKDIRTKLHGEYKRKV